MIRVTVSYPLVPGQRFDHAYYGQQHAALIRQLLTPHGLLRLEIDQGLVDGAGGPPPTVAAAHLVFTSLDAFQSGMAAVGAQLLADVNNYTDTAPAVLVCETW